MCIPLIILAFMIYIYSSKTLAEKAQMTMNQVATIEGRALEILVRTKEEQVKILSVDKTVINILEKRQSKDDEGVSRELGDVESLLKHIEENEEECCGVYIIDCKGAIIASSKQKYIQSNMSINEDFKGVLKGKSVFKNIITQEKEENTDITVPVKDDDGRILGAVCKVIKNKVFGGVVEEIKSNERGCAYIVDDEGTIIIHPEQAKIGEKLEDEQVMNVLKGEGPISKMNRWVMAGMDNGVLNYMAFYRLSNVGWIIVVEQKAKAVQNQAVTELGIVVGTIAFLIFVLGIAIIHLSRRITDPIEEMVTVMTEVSKGKLDQYCKYVANDEFGSLAKHYNQMIKNLGESRAALSESEERYRETLADIEETIWEYDLNTDMVFITGKWSDIIKAEDELEGNVPYKEVIKYKALEGIEKDVQACQKGKKNVFSREVSVQGIGGSIVWGLCKGKVVYNEAGEMVKIRGIITDINELC